MQFFLHCSCWVWGTLPYLLLFRTLLAHFLSTWIPKNQMEFVVFLPCHQPHLVSWVLCICCSFFLKCSSHKYIKIISSFPSGSTIVLSRGFAWTHYVNLSTRIFFMPVIPLFFYFSSYCQLISLFSFLLSVFSFFPPSFSLFYYYNLSLLIRILAH